MNIADHIKSLEETLLDPAVRKNSEQVSNLLADDFLEFGSSGRTFDKAAILEDLRNEPPHQTARSVTGSPPAMFGFQISSAFFSGSVKQFMM